MFEDSQYRTWANEGSNLPPGFVDEHDTNRVRGDKRKLIKQSTDKSERIAKYEAEKAKLERYVKQLQDEIDSGTLNNQQKWRNEDMIVNLNHAILNIKY
jgi:ABC-type phosphate transport system auxiliary subunit